MPSFALLGTSALAIASLMRETGSHKLRYISSDSVDDEYVELDADLDAEKGVYADAGLYTELNADLYADADAELDSEVERGS